MKFNKNDMHKITICKSKHVYYIPCCCVVVIIISVIVIAGIVVVITSSLPVGSLVPSEAVIRGSRFMIRDR